MAFIHDTFMLPIAQSSSSRSIFYCRSVPFPALRTCRICKKVFNPSENNPSACRFHPATWAGAERSKFYGRIPESSASSTTQPQSRGVEYFYDCCDALTVDEPGCTFGFHRTYDE